MTTAMKSENMVSVQLSGEAFGFTGLNKQQFEAMLATAIKCDLTFTDRNGEQFKMEIIQDVKVDNISLCDEFGIEILDENE